MNQGSKKQENGQKVNILQKGVKIAPKYKYFSKASNEKGKVLCRDFYRDNMFSVYWQTL